MGEHTGYAGYTVGQRKGLGGGFPEPMFVLDVRPDRREVVVGRYDELFRDTVSIAELNWLGPAPEPGDAVAVQLRYRAPAVGATVVSTGETLVLSLDDPQAAVTPGQSGVVFEGDRVLGGGRIASSALKALPAKEASAQM